MLKISDHGGAPFGGGGGQPELNIFTQLTEPKTYEGLWLQTDNKYKKIVNDNIIWSANTLIDSNLFPALPYRINSNNIGAVCGKDGFLYIVINAGYTAFFYKFNIEENTITQFATKVYSSQTASQMPVKVFEVYGNNEVLYFTNGTLFFINVDTGEERKMTCYNPDGTGYGWSENNLTYGTLHNDDVYFVGHRSTLSSGAQFTQIVRTNCTTGETVALTPAPNEIKYAKPLSYGGFIYVFGGVGSLNILRYDILNDTWEIVGKVMAKTSHNIVSVFNVEGRFFMLSYTEVSEYNFSDDTWSVIITFPTERSGGQVVFLKDKIYFLGGGNDMTVGRSITPYTFTAKPFDDKTLIFIRNDEVRGKYYTEFSSPKTKHEGLHQRFATGFDDAYMYYENDVQQNIPSYYGDGKQWIKFKN